MKISNFVNIISKISSIREKSIQIKNQKSKNFVLLNLNWKYQWINDLFFLLKNKASAWEGGGSRVEGDNGGNERGHMQYFQQ